MGRARGRMRKLKRGKLLNIASVEIILMDLLIRNTVVVRSCNILSGALREKTDIGGLLKERFGWTCEADEALEVALSEQVCKATYLFDYRHRSKSFAHQVVAIELEKQQLLSRQATDGACLSGPF